MNKSPFAQVEQPGEKFEIPKAYALPYNWLAIMRLAFSTAILIATLLTIPTIVALYPGTPEFEGLVVRSVGVWLSVFIQWFLVFLGILLALSFITGPLVVDNRGIKLWRFGKIVPWNKIEGLTCQKASMFFRILPFYNSASRLTIFVDDGKRLKSRNLDSLFFTASEFNCLFQLLTLKSFDISPNSQSVFLFKPETCKKFVSGHKKLALRSGIIRAYIFVVVILFFGSHTTKYYLYNASAIDMNQKKLVDARSKLEYATRIDNGFAIAWDRLARVHYRMKNFEKAKNCWKRAIKLKPDLVTAQVGMSSIYIVKSDFVKAEKILSTVIQTNPRYIPALLNLAQVNFKLGKRETAIDMLGQAMELSAENNTVCSAAHALFEAEVGKKNTVPIKSKDGVERR